MTLADRGSWLRAASIQHGSGVRQTRDRPAPLPRRCPALSKFESYWTIGWLIIAGTASMLAVCWLLRWLIAGCYSKTASTLQAPEINP